VYLPALPAEASAEMIEDDSDRSISQPVTGGVILVADDNADVRRLACMQLEQAGYEVREAADGAEAIEVFKQHVDTIGLVILDVVMPGVGGQAAAVEIRKIRSGVPLFFISGYSPEVAGFDALPEKLLKKPFKAIELLGLVEQQLGVSVT
jgi:CheY-like chemotaxis protein